MNKTPAVGWARWGRLSGWLARTIQPRRPSVLVVSLPGSGSSWVGETLGQASDALYLREPLTQPHLTSGGREAVIALDDQLPAAYWGYAADAFAALPRFGANIVKFPRQWRLSERRWRRLVVKEVNPLACGWLVQRYDLRVIFLVRHPMAVAARARRLKFWAGPGPEVFEANGHFQADSLHLSRQALPAHAALTVVRYEDLCADPLAQFRRLFEFAGLAWDARTETYIQSHTHGGDRSLPYAVARDSRGMIDAWRGEVAPEETRRLELGFRTRELPWYQSPEEW